MIDNKEYFYKSESIEILKEVSVDDTLLVFYKRKNGAGNIFITGDKYDWQVGLQYVEELGHVADVYYIDDETRRAIEQELKTL